MIKKIRKEKGLGAAIS
uniref:Uncharacterized protein n=1 Tax=Anguilla anguilla TaxID=7936 RepID=A0A0E9QM69_ANGAN